MSDERIYRAVPLTADEAAYLSRCGGERTKCCGHLDLFHNHGRRVDGGHWRSCWICHCVEEAPLEEYTAYFERQRREEREAFWSAFGQGVFAVVGILAVVVAILVMVHG